MHLIIFAFVLIVPLSAHAQPVDRAAATDSLDRYFESWNTVGTPGCAVAVAESGETRLAAAYGMADLEHHVANTPSTLFEAGSVSKQFAAAAIILMELDGKLSLDDDIREYVPEVPDYGHEITLRHLLMHTSGLRDWGSVAAISGWGRGNRSHTHDHVLDIISRQTKLNFEPGERYSYSNSGYNLLAIVGDRAADSTFTHYTEEHIFKPLGMNHTSWRDDYTRIVEGRSTAYSPRTDTTYSINRPIEHVYGNAALLTTVHDLLIWNNALDSAELGEAFTARMEEQGVLNNGRTSHYGMALQHLTTHDHPVIQHTGATSGYRAYLSRFPDAELSVALLCNTSDASPGALGSQVAGLFLEDRPSTSEQDSTVDVSADQLQQFTGLYRNPLNNTTQELVVSNDTLQIEGGPHLNALSENHFRVGSSERSYRFEGGNGRPMITILEEGFEEGEMHPVESFDPSEAELAPFTGTYYAEDAETEIRIVMEEGELRAERRPDSQFEMNPTFTDAFSASGFGRIQFYRNESGEPSAFRLSRGRVYDMHFERVD